MLFFDIHFLSSFFNYWRHEFLCIQVLFILCKQKGDKWKFNSRKEIECKANLQHIKISNGKSLSKRKEQDGLHLGHRKKKEQD